MLTRLERVLEDLDLDGTALHRPTHRHAGHVEASPRRVGPGREEEHLRELADLALLARRHRLEPAAERRARSRLHLAEHEQPAARQDQVELTERTSPIA